MRRLIMLLSVVVLLSCGNGEQQQAEQLLQTARDRFEQGDFAASLQLIDSLRTTYPRQLEARREALKLYQEASMGAARADLARTDSLLQTARAAFDSLDAVVTQHRADLTATAEELSALTFARIRRDSLQTRFDALIGKVQLIRKKQTEQ